MEANNQEYSHINSDERIKDILNSAESFDELDDIPGRERLTYSNGFYVNCTALFIDIRGSSGLTENHMRPVLGKLYRAYISECVAVMNGSPKCREIYINGDCVSGIFSTPYKDDIDSVFDTAARLHSVTNLLNWRLAQKGYATFLCGIGMDYGRALMMKAGYRGSGINDVIWMGDVVNGASNLCHEGNQPGRAPLQVATVIHDNLKPTYKGFLSPVHKTSYLKVDQYEGNVINIEMDGYLAELQKKAEAARYNGLYNALLGTSNPPNLLQPGHRGLGFSLEDLFRR